MMGNATARAEAGRRYVVPPHIAWPAFVVLLLLIGIGSAFAALWAANSDGGALLVREPVEQTETVVTGEPAGQAVP